MDAEATSVTARGLDRRLSSPPVTPHPMPSRLEAAVATVAQRWGNPEPREILQKLTGAMFMRLPQLIFFVGPAEWQLIEVPGEFGRQLQHELHALERAALDATLSGSVNHCRVRALHDATSERHEHDKRSGVFTTTKTVSTSSSATQYAEAVVCRGAEFSPQEACRVAQRDCRRQAFHSRAARQARLAARGRVAASPRLPSPRSTRAHTAAAEAPTRAAARIHRDDVIEAAFPTAPDLQARAIEILTAEGVTTGGALCLLTEGEWHALVRDHGLPLGCKVALCLALRPEQPSPSGLFPIVVPTEGPATSSVSFRFSRQEDSRETVDATAVSVGLRGFRHREYERSSHRRASVRFEVEGAWADVEPRTVAACLAHAGAATCILPIEQQAVALRAALASAQRSVPCSSATIAEDAVAVQRAVGRLPAN
jgi:hypothetical protein